MSSLENHPFAAIRKPFPWNSRFQRFSISAFQPHPRLRSPQRRPRAPRPNSGFLAIAASIFLLSHANLQADAYIVTQTSGTGAGTLYDAITQANAHPGADTIDLRHVSGTISLFSALPTITGNTGIIGDGDLKIDGRNTFRHFDIEPSSSTLISVLIESMILENGKAPGGAAERDYWGGSIRAFEQDNLILTILDCVFRNNESYMGGAVTAYVSVLNVINCSFIGNQANKGGAFAGSPNIGVFRNCTFAQNAATIEAGGAVHIHGSSTFSHCTIANNSATTSGGGVYVSSGNAVFEYSAVANNTAANSSSNIATGSGGAVSYLGTPNFLFGGDPKLAPLGLYHHSFLPTFNLLSDSPLRDAATGSTIDTDQRGVGRPQNSTPDIGAFEAKVYHVTPALPDSGQGSLREAIATGSDIIDMSLCTGLYTPSSALPKLDGMVLTGPGADKFAIAAPSDSLVFDIRDAAPVVLEGLHIGPSIRSSGLTGVFVLNSTLWLLDCHFKECIGQEGGVTLKAYDSDVKISGCCFNANETRGSSGVLLSLDSATLIENSTFSGNQAHQGARGGAILSNKTGLSAHDSTLEINHCTFYNNSADGDGGHLWIGSTVDSALMKNTLMLAGTAGGSGPQIHDPGSNLLSESNYFGSDPTGVIDTALEFNDGTTPTHRLLPAALPIDAAHAAGSPETDQRGVQRDNEGALPDIGAFEFIASKYRRWLAGYFGFEQIAPASDFPFSPIHFQDPDGDGGSNIEEFLFHMDPTVPDTPLLPQFVKESVVFSDYGGISFRENFDAPGEIGYLVERSTDLNAWTSAGMTAAFFSPAYQGYSIASYFSSQAIGAPFGLAEEFYRVRVLPPVDEPKLAYVRDPGNSADTTGRGSVAEIFRIGTHEVTNTEYVRFLNAADTGGVDSLDIYNTEQETNPASGIEFNAAASDGRHYSAKFGSENLPVVLIDYWDAVRYANWRHNGAAPGSDTEDGAYTLEGGTATPTNADSLTGRNPGARFFLPTVDEWYKAAYHTGSGVYTPYPTSRHFVNNNAPPGDVESANYNSSTLHPVGSYPMARNHHLLYDMGGNADEFIEKSAATGRVLNMGGHSTGDDTLLHSSNWNLVDSTTEDRYDVTGFRIAASKE